MGIGISDEVDPVPVEKQSVRGKEMGVLSGLPEGQQEAEGLRLCLERIKSLQQIKGVKGVHIMSVGNEEKLPEIIEQAGLPS